MFKYRSSILIWFLFVLILLYQAKGVLYTEGINQTIHRLVMRVQTTVRMLVPIRAEDIVVSMDFILAEQIIVGRIPDSYITGISEDNIFDLMP